MQHFIFINFIFFSIKDGGSNNNTCDQYFIAVISISAKIWKFVSGFPQIGLQQLLKQRGCFPPCREFDLALCFAKMLIAFSTLRTSFLFKVYNL